MKQLTAYQAQEILDRLIGQPLRRTPWQPNLLVVDSVDPMTPGCELACLEPGNPCTTFLCDKGSAILPRGLTHKKVAAAIAVLRDSD